MDLTAARKQTQPDGTSRRAAAGAIALQIGHRCGRDPSVRKRCRLEAVTGAIVRDRDHVPARVLAHCDCAICRTGRHCDPLRPSHESPGLTDRTGPAIATIPYQSRDPDDNAGRRACPGSEDAGPPEFMQLKNENTLLRTYSSNSSQMMDTQRRVGWARRAICARRAAAPATTDAQSRTRRGKLPKGPSLSNDERKRSRLNRAVPRPSYAAACSRGW
jgi:hypothetical protein